MEIDLLHCEYCTWLATWIINGKAQHHCHKDPDKHPIQKPETEYCKQYEENYPAKQIKAWAKEREAQEEKVRPKIRQLGLFEE